jgi:sugar diacid utilization regulator
MDRESNSTVERLVREALGFQRLLTEAVSSGVGLEGIARILSETANRPAAVWGVNGVAPAVYPAEARPPMRPTPHTTSSWRDDTVFRHHAWLWRATEPAGPDSLAVVGIADPEDAVSDRERLALEEAAAIVALEVYRMKSVAAAEVRVWGDLSDEILDDDNRARVRAHAEALGFDHRAERRVALVTAVEIEIDALLTRVRWAVRLVGADALVTARENRVVVIVSDGLDWPVLVQVLRDAMRGERFSIGVSSLRNVVEDYQDAAREAEVAVGLGAAIGGDGVTHFEDLGVYRLLAANGNTTELNQYVQRWLGPLIEYDRTRNASLVRTLSEYLERGGSLDQAAETLFIHRSTLKYRLGRIATLTGVDLADPDARFNLQLATRTLATIRALEMDRSSPGPEGAV